MTLTWNHTRTNKPMRITFDNKGSAMIRVMFVRAIYPNHPFYLNGVAI